MTGLLLLRSLQLWIQVTVLESRTLFFVNSASSIIPSIQLLTQVFSDAVVPNRKMAELASQGSNPQERRLLTDKCFSLLSIRKAFVTKFIKNRDMLLPYTALTTVNS